MFTNDKIEKNEISLIEEKRRTTNHTDLTDIYNTLKTNKASISILT